MTNNKAANKMFNKILIANRGEIACRVIDTAKKMGIKTVAVYSDADANSLHVKLADEAVNIGAAPSRESYLVIDKIINAALRTGAQAIHPGYGFLSENADFCEACASNNLVFIGPPVGAIKAMGSKSAAKTIMEQAQVPLVPGYHGDDQDPALLKKASDDMGYPVLLKATAGGGGKGMRQVWSADEFDEALAAAKREALNGFNDDTMLVEKYLTQPRHVEIQVFCDQHGNAVYLAERDCSVQRRHQKVIEEAPAPGMTQTLRDAMGQAAISAAQAINYVGAGTVEFLLDVDGSFFFMEMNTRLQVEHPVTELITGQDLVEWQLRVANGETLPLTQDQIQINGHAFEARIYAEDPANDFLPVTGQLHFLQTPDESNHVRVDTGVLQGDEISIYYDPMIAKLIVWDENRDKALQRLTTALREYRIGGMVTNIDFLHTLASCEPFQQADLDTSFIEKHDALIFNTPESQAQSQTDQLNTNLCLAALYLSVKRQRLAQQQAQQSNDPTSPWHEHSAWRLNDVHSQSLTFEHNETAHELQLIQTEDQYDIRIGETTIKAHANNADNQLIDNQLYVEINGLHMNFAISEHSVGGQQILTIFSQNETCKLAIVEPDLGLDTESDQANLTAPMNGRLVTLLVDTGSHVAKGDALLIMESMKMEHTITAPSDGQVEEFYFQADDLVTGGVELLKFVADDA